MSQVHNGIMKFELKTDHDHYSKNLFFFFYTFLFILLIIIISNISLKLGIISKQYELNYLCKLVAVDKSSPNFKKLSKIFALNSKQKIWELCREIVK